MDGHQNISEDGLGKTSSDVFKTNIATLCEVMVKTGPEESIYYMLNYLYEEIQSCRQEENGSFDDERQYRAAVALWTFLPLLPSVDTGEIVIKKSFIAATTELLRNLRQDDRNPYLRDFAQKALNPL